MRIIIVAVPLYALILSLPLFGDDFIQTQKRYVKELCLGGKNFECVAEVKRLLFYEKNKTNACDYSYIVGAAFFKGKQYKSAVISLKKSECDGELPRVKALIAMSYLRLGFSDSAVELLCPLSYEQIEEPLRFRLLTMKIEMLLYQKEYEPIHRELRKAGNYLSGKEPFLSYSELTEEYASKGYKSKVLAVALSAFVPGAGQIYAGRVLQGLLSFISVAATGGGAWLLYRSGHRDYSYVCMFFAGLFYVGNLYGASNASDSWNYERMNRFIKEVREKYSEYDPMRDFGSLRVLQ